MNHLTYGFKNLGSTCFFNCAVQSLLSIPKLDSFLQLVSTSPYKKHPTTFIDMLLSLKNDPSNIIRTYILLLKHDSKYDNFSEQHDVHECLLSLFDMIDIEVKKSFTVKVESIFEIGKIAIYLKCNECGYNSKKDESFSILSLPMNNAISSLKDCFIEYMDDKNNYEIVEWECDKCKAVKDGMKTTRIKTLPPFLFIHFNRFNFDFDSE